VGLREVTGVAEVRHRVANGGGAQVIGAVPRDGTRGHRLPGLDIGLDDGVQDLLFAADHSARVYPKH